MGGKGPKDLEGRRCTDLLCLVFFGAFWVGMISLTSVIYAHGDINKIFYGTDYLGNTCARCEEGDRTCGRRRFYTELRIVWKGAMCFELLCSLLFDTSTTAKYNCCSPLPRT